MTLAKPAPRLPVRPTHVTPSIAGITGKVEQCEDQLVAPAEEAAEDVEKEEDAPAQEQPAAAAAPVQAAPAPPAQVVARVRIAVPAAEQEARLQAFLADWIREMRENGNASASNTAP